MRVIPPSELIINEDGTIFHLHLCPAQLSDVVVLVGDPARVELVASHFESVECRVQNREFCTITGEYRGRRMSVVSTGIGCDNIDIVLTELDALANIELKERKVRDELKRLTIVRLGTSGGVQPTLRVGDMVLARTSIGFDGVLGFYAGGEQICDHAAEDAFMRHMEWRKGLATPYFVDSCKELNALFAEFTIAGITIAANGFYAPQGRHVRLRPATEGFVERIESFEWQGRQITNFEMESSAVAGLAQLMGHRATTICTIIAQRVAQEVDTDYTPYVERMIERTLDVLSKI